MNVKIKVIFDEIPRIFVWGNRRFLIDKIGLHHTYRQGRKLMHVFSVLAGKTFFRLEMDSETLNWKLMEVADGLPD